MSKPLRLPLTPTIEVRGTNLNKDATMRNCYAEADAIQEPTVIKRPGLDAKISALGGGNAMFFYGDQIYIWTYPLATTGDPRLSAYGNGTMLFPYGPTTSGSPNVYRAKFVGETTQDIDNTDFRSDTASGFGGTSDAWFANGKFYINEGNGGAYRLRYSTDAITWSNATTPSTNRVYSHITGNATILVGSQIAGTGGTDDNNVIYSVDNGLNWTLRAPDGITTSIRPPYAANTSRVTNGNYYTANGSTWTLCTNGFTTTNIVRGTSVFAAFNRTTNTFKTSTDGISWTDRTWPFVTSPNMLNVFLGTDSVFYAFAEEATVSPTSRYFYKSTDGITWTFEGNVTVPDQNAASPLVRARFYNGLFYSNILKNKKVNSSYLYARVPYLAYSKDGLNWSDMRLEVNGFDNSPTTISGI